MASIPNETMLKFLYPDSLVKEYEHWVVLSRPKQSTLGALVLACKENAQAFSTISQGAFFELPKVVVDIENGLKAFRSYDKINYLMLMMVDKEVHYHVLPRYSADQSFQEETFLDPGWPALADLTHGPELSGQGLESMTTALKAVWPE